MPSTPFMHSDWFSVLFNLTQIWLECVFCGRCVVAILWSRCTILFQLFVVVGEPVAGCGLTVARLAMNNGKLHPFAQVFKFHLFMYCFICLCYIFLLVVDG